MCTSRVIVPLLFTLSCSSFADQIVLKNGDRLTGTIQKSDDKSLLIKTEFAGEVTVQWPAVEDIKPEQQLHVGLKDGRTLVGPVTTGDGTIAVSTKAGGSVEAPRENVVVMRSDAEQLAWEKKQHYTQETPTPVPPNFQPHITRNLAAGTIGDQFMHKLSKNSEITQDAYFFPDFSGGDFRATFDLGTVTKISKWLGWQNSFGDIYVSNPPAGKQKNDIVFTTGLNVTVTH